MNKKNRILLFILAAALGALFTYLLTPKEINNLKQAMNERDSAIEKANEEYEEARQECLRIFDDCVEPCGPNAEDHYNRYMICEATCRRIGDDDPRGDCMVACRLSVDMTKVYCYEDCLFSYQDCMKPVNENYNDAYQAAWNEFVAEVKKITGRETSKSVWRGYRPSATIIDERPY